MEKNPLIEAFDTPYGIPPFHAIESPHFLPAIKANIEKARAEIAAILSIEEEPTFKNTIEALEYTGEMLGLSAGVLFNLNAAETNPDIQKAAMEVSPLLTEFHNDIAQNEALFERINKVYHEKEQLELTAEEQMLLDKTYKRFVRSGAKLDAAQKDAFRAITKELAELELKFGEHVLAETNRYELHITDENDLAGLPDYIIEAAADTAKSKQKEGYVFTLQAPSYIPFMEHADNRALREKLFKAYMSKGIKGDEYDNREIIQKIVKLRLEKAQLLGYKSYADYVLEERMANSQEGVSKFLDELLEKALPKAKAEVEEIKAFVKARGEDLELQRWDWAYYSEKLKKEKYSISDELLKPYFRLEQVIDGVFKVAQKLYGLNFVQENDLPKYHKDVTTYRVTDNKDRLMAIFFADFFPREGKRGGAWMTAYRDMYTKDGEEMRPLVSIVCNFTPPSSKRPSLLTFDEVRTLFHEFGHALHAMLAEGRYSSLTGTSVFWDFVELPSQIMENWTFEKACLDLFASHYETNEKIPQELIDKIIAAANYHEAYQTVRQVSFAKLDMAWHSITDVSQIGDVLAFEKEVFVSTELFPPVDNTCMSAQFGHIFNGGYAAGYYSYKWAEVLDADAYAMFKEHGIFDEAVAQSFKEHILSKGGSEHPMVLYKRFRKKEPTIDALLERSGLAS